jgi:ABC-2 family transporter protein
MIWLTWRQFRAQAATAVAALAAFAILLALTRPRMDSLYAASGIAGCHSGRCGALASQFLNRLASATPFSGRSFDPLPQGFDLYTFVYVAGTLCILAAPAIVGIFWGAPLIARELETGTGRLVWNQSVTRTRWLMVKLTLIGLAAMAVTEAFTLLQAWWATPIGRAMGLGASASVFSGSRFGALNFATDGITPLGYAAFGFALGVSAGILFRRPVPAMAVTLAIFAAVQFAMPVWVRPHLIPPSQMITTTEATQANLMSFRGGLMLSASIVPGQPGAWITSSRVVNAARQPVRTTPAACLSALSTAATGSSGNAPSQQPFLRCLDSQGIREVVRYQPTSHFWPLQFVETGIFLALALALAGFCFWRMGRRLT